MSEKNESPTGTKPRLSCPFCGSASLFTEPDEWGSGGQWVSPIHVGCKECKAEQSADTEEEAVKRWNRRSSPAPSAPGDAQDDETQAILRWIMRTAESEKEDCGMDPETPAAIRNGRLAAIASAAAQALGLHGGPSYQVPAAGDALDAARYRWLRDIERFAACEEDGAIYTRRVQITSGVMTASEVLTEEDLDAAIDAAQVPQQGEA